MKTPGRQLKLPLCVIPEEIVVHYVERVKKFYDGNKKERVEEFAKVVEKKQGIEFKVLEWDDHLGLTSISFSGGGLDLSLCGENPNRFVFHNIAPEDVYGKAAFMVARRYIDLL